MLNITKTFAGRLAESIHRGLIVAPQSSRHLATTAKLNAGADEMLKVGPWPRTKEERERAARKYNLIPEDYEPHDEEEGMGDYPKLKAVGAFNRDRYEDFDDPLAKRCYGEPYHRDSDLHYWERIDPLESEKGHVSYKRAFVAFVGIILVIPGSIFVAHLCNYHITQPLKYRTTRHQYRPIEPNRKYYEFPHSPNDGGHH